MIETPLFLALPRTLWLLALLIVGVVFEARWHRRQPVPAPQWTRRLATRALGIAVLLVAVSQPCWRTSSVGGDATFIPLAPVLLLFAALWIPIDAWLRRSA